MNKRQEYYYKNIPKYREYQNQRKERIRNVVEQLKELGCFYCDELDFCCLDFHHIEKKEFNIAFALSQGFGINKLVKEIEKCEILCSNCHRKKIYNKKTSLSACNRPEQVKTLVMGW